jgi:hypothetical protein
MAGIDGSFEQMLRQGKPLPPGLMNGLAQHQQAMLQVPPVALVSHCHWYRIGMMHGEVMEVAVLGTLNQLAETLIPLDAGRSMKNILLIPVALSCVEDPKGEEPVEDNLILFHAIAEMKVLRPFSDEEMAATVRRQEKAQKAALAKMEGKP